MRKHFCGHTSNTSDFQTSSFQEAMCLVYYHSCSVTSLTVISDCGFGFFTFTLAIALYRHKALHILNTDIYLSKNCLFFFFTSFLVFQVTYPCVCIPERLESMAQIPFWLPCFLNSPNASSNTNTNKHRARERLHWSVVATHKHTQWVCLDVFPVLSSHDTLSEHASKKKKLIKSVLRLCCHLEATLNTLNPDRKLWC